MRDSGKTLTEFRRFSHFFAGRIHEQHGPGSGAPNVVDKTMGPVLLTACRNVTDLLRTAVAPR